MRRVRWKSKYSSGISKIDNHNKNLLNILNDLVIKANQLEHCQDLSDLHKHIGELVEIELQKIDTGQFKEIQDLLIMELPLAARNTQACHDCNLCDHLDEQVGQWLKLDKVNKFTVKNE
ncbi:MAG TPA: hypothetical protein ENK59_07350 [Thioploca sp.]|nr:hypothetical protein [Thioploca sp.]